jgi:hypothetical protein
MLKPFMDIDELSQWIGKTPATIRVDLGRRPETLPPAIKVPGTRGWLFKRSTVEEWLSSFERPRNQQPAPTVRRRGRPRKQA